MTRARAVLALLVLSGTRTVWAEPCTPRVELAGDRDAIAMVGAQLRALGVELAPAGRGGTGSGGGAGGVTAGGCRVVRAVVEVAGEGAIAVAVHGSTRGSEGRVVSDPALAAAWIDSWTRDDLDAALWAAPPVAPLAPPAPVATTSREQTDVAQPGPSSLRTRWMFDAELAQLASSDGATWRGGSITLARDLGRFAIGGRARFVIDPTRNVGATAMTRNDAALLATAAYPLTVGAMRIAPEAALGIGRTATARVERGCTSSEPPMEMCDPMDPMCTMTDPATGACDPNASGIRVGDNFATATYGPRIELGLRIAVPLVWTVSLDAFAGASLAPLAQTDPYVPSATTMLDEMSASLVRLPGEPTWGWLFGLGVRVGASR